MNLRTALLTCAAMLAFAANSLLARLALSETNIDPALFTAVRLCSGAFALWVYIRLSRGNKQTDSGNWLSAVALFVYGAAFSFAYTSLSAATGALILFAAVQATMLGYGFVRGERFNWRQTTGFLIAAAGFVVLLAPGVSAPSIQGSLLMVAAGCGWGAYSLRRGSGDAAEISADNFLRCVPFAVVLVILFFDQLQLDSVGVAYAMASGMLASAAGYIAWYAALGNLSIANASTVQLSVPAITALLAIALLSETLNTRIVLASITMLGGIAIVIRTKRVDT